jgi:hypothetical protein
VVELLIARCADLEGKKHGGCYPARSGGENGFSEAPGILKNVGQIPDLPSPKMRNSTA